MLQKEDFLKRYIFKDTYVIRHTLEIPLVS